MVKPEAPDWFSWTISLVLHLEILVFAALLLGDELEPSDDEDPVIHTGVAYSSMAYLRPKPIYQVPSDWTGRWPMDCKHEALVRLYRKWPAEVLPDKRCEVCQWPWWVIQASLLED